MAQKKPPVDGFFIVLARCYRLRHMLCAKAGVQRVPAVTAQGSVVVAVAAVHMAVCHLFF